MVTEIAAALTPGRLVAVRLAGFVRFLRAQGFDVGARETIDGLRLLDLAGVAAEREVRTGLRALACGSPEDWQRFERAYDLFWHPRKAEQAELEAEGRRDPRVPPGAHVRGGHTGLSHAMDTEAWGAQPEQDQARRGGAGRQMALSHTDFRLLVDRDQIRLMEHQAEILARRIRRQPTRRLRDSNRGRSVSLRRTLRRSLAYGGTPLRLAYRARRREPLKLVLLLDVSHSMAQYSFFLARFVRGLIRCLPQSEAFVFHTRLHRLTDLFRGSDPEALRRRLQSMNQLWFGGTRIADSLRCFNDQYASRLLDSRSLVVILSDGFDSDAPAELTTELQRIRSRARRIAWLDPMLGRDGYVMDEVNLLAAQPLLDYLGPGHSVAALRYFGEYLARI